MKTENIQDIWTRAKDGFMSVIHSLKNKKNQVEIETQDYVSETKETSGEYDYDKDSESGQVERYS